MSVNRSFNLAKLEQSILREYKRTSFGDDTPQYQIQSIYYSEIPKELPTALSSSFKQSIVLINYSYFEMVSFAVFEHLFVLPSETRKIVIDRIKGRICNPNFMFGHNYIKGLLVKGLREVTDNAFKTTKPIAQILMKNDAMNAFSEFWKEVIQEQCEGSGIKHSDIPQGEAYRLIGNFLGLNFQLFWKRQEGYEQERLISETMVTDQMISLFIFEKTLVESIITKVLQESIANQSNERGYVLLLPDAPKSSPSTNEITKTSEVQQLKGRASAVTKKGSELLNKFRQFYRDMRENIQ